jgi:hypothetical protein
MPTNPLLAEEKAVSLNPPTTKKDSETQRIPGVARKMFERSLDTVGF